MLRWLTLVLICRSRGGCSGQCKAALTNMESTHVSVAGLQEYKQLPVRLTKALPLDVLNQALDGFAALAAAKSCTSGGAASAPYPDCLLF